MKRILPWRNSDGPEGRRGVHTASRLAPGWTGSGRRGTRLLILVAIGIICGSILYYVETSLTEIREGLPVEVMSQERDVALMVQRLANLMLAVQAARTAPTQANLETIRKRLRSAREHIHAVRRTYNLDNLIGASAMHAAAQPAVEDMARWMEKGLHGFPPGSPVVLGLVHHRARQTYQEVRHLFAESNKAALELLDHERRRIERFRDSLSLVFVFVAGLVVVLATFITAQHRSERVAAQARERLHQAIASIGDGFALFDASGRLALCNANYGRLFLSMPEGPARGRHFADLIREAVAAGDIVDAECDREGWIERRIAAFENPGEALFEVRLRDGRIVRVSERRTADGSTVAILSDVTELRSVSEELRRNNILLDAALSNMGQGLIMLDSRLRMIICNSRYLELYDFPLELGRPGVPLESVVRFYHERAGSDADEIDRQLRWRIDIASSREETSDLEFLHDGRVIDLHHRPMADGGSVVTYEDITERYRAGEALRQAKEEAEIASRAKSDFLANVSHELRTPLNAIIGFAEILEREMFGRLGDTRYHTYAQDIRDSGQHLLSLINDILDLSKIEAGKYALRDEHVSVEGAIATCLRIVGERAESAGVEIENDTGAPLPALRGDERALKQILLNLLTNAVKFTPRGGRVVVSAGVAGSGELVICLSDTGIGIEPHDISKAMAPFGQVDSTLSRRYEGTGLGLPLTRRLAELHGGWLELKSRPGEGTTACVGIPAARLVTCVPQRAG